MERTVYQVFEVDSAITTITVDVIGFAEVQVSSWAGSSVLTEANIQVWNASPEIVKFLIDEGRYAFLTENKSNIQEITSKVRERKPIKTRAGECTEIATVKIFVPDTFEIADESKKVLRRKEIKKTE